MGENRVVPTLRLTILSRSGYPPSELIVDEIYNVCNYYGKHKVMENFAKEENGYRMTVRFNNVDQSTKAFGHLAQVFESNKSSFGDLSVSYSPFAEKIWVGNVHRTATKHMLEEFCRNTARVEIMESYLVPGAKFGFLWFKNVNDAMVAVLQLQGKKFPDEKSGWPLAVDFETPKTTRPHSNLVEQGASESLVVRLTDNGYGGHDRKIKEAFSPNRKRERDDRNFESKTQLYRNFNHNDTNNNSSNSNYNNNNINNNTHHHNLHRNDNYKYGYNNYNNSNSNRKSSSTESNHRNVVKDTIYNHSEDFLRPDRHLGSHNSGDGHNGRANQRQYPLKYPDGGSDVRRTRSDGINQVPKEIVSPNDPRRNNRPKNVFDQIPSNRTNLQRSQAIRANLRNSNQQKTTSKDQESPKRSEEDAMLLDDRHENGRGYNHNTIPSESKDELTDNDPQVTADDPSVVQNCDFVDERRSRSQSKSPSRSPSRSPLRSPSRSRSDNPVFSASGTKLRDRNDRCRSKSPNGHSSSSSSSGSRASSPSNRSARSHSRNKSKPSRKNFDSPASRRSNSASRRSDSDSDSDRSDSPNTLDQGSPSHSPRNQSESFSQLEGLNPSNSPAKLLGLSPSSVPGDDSKTKDKSSISRSKSPPGGQTESRPHSPVNKSSPARSNAAESSEARRYNSPPSSPSSKKRKLIATPNHENVGNHIHLAIDPEHSRSRDSRELCSMEEFQELQNRVKVLEKYVSQANDVQAQPHAKMDSLACDKCNWYFSKVRHHISKYHQLDDTIIKQTVALWFKALYERVDNNFIQGVITCTQDQLLAEINKYLSAMKWPEWTLEDDLFKTWFVPEILGDREGLPLEIFLIPKQLP